jgi:deferrochelatase/peroxidase EfeB
MTADAERVQSERVRLPTDELSEVQKLALTGYDFDNSVHLVLQVTDTGKAQARRFLAELLQQELPTFGDRARGDDHAINIGLTFQGLVKLEVDERYLQELALKAPAFCEGAPSRAARHLGDSGESAAERWDHVYWRDNAHALISIHAVNEHRAREVADQLAAVSGAQDGFKGWDKSDRVLGEHLTKDRGHRKVHFGFRDNIVRPVIAGAPGSEERPCHSAGELLLGYPNDEGFNRWADRTPEETARFFRNGSFAVFRKIEQHEDRLDDFLTAQSVELLRARNEKLSESEAVVQCASLKTYLKAKLCGRWPNGARVQPGENSPPPDPTSKKLEADSEFNFADDPQGHGCPFGAHIRRTSPRDDPVLPLRRRPLFRRAMPYGPPVGVGRDNAQRGLIGLFFCASIEDQFEHVMSEWIEKMPMGPPSSGDAKDPLVGNNDDFDSAFDIPSPDGRIRLRGFQPFVTTHGTLYAFYPSRHALHQIIG